MSELKKPLRKGELKCSNISNCDECPLFSLRCYADHRSPSLYTTLNEIKVELSMPEKVYKEFKEILDEEVEE